MTKQGGKCPQICIKWKLLQRERERERKREKEREKGGERERERKRERQRVRNKKIASPDGKSSDFKRLQIQI